MLSIVTSLVALATAPPTVTVTTGQLRGAYTADEKVAYFRDIPFALAERFERPKPAVPWTGVREASALGPGCQQHHSSHNPDVPTNQTEDCTRLNVYTPASALLAATKQQQQQQQQQQAPLLPVMVWWHGGAFKEGSSFGPFNLYDGSALARQHGVIIVSCNYRLDVYGALVLDGAFEGNQGFYDQRMCLEWVRDEIHHFGGDASQVTAWGQSAGAQSVYLHMASNGSRGLFHRAILESAPDLSLFDSNKDAGKLGAEFAKEVGCKNWTTAAKVKCLKAAHVDDIVRAADKAQSNFFTLVTTISLKHPTASFLPFKPHVDGVTFTEQPLKTLLDGKATNTVPALVGFNHDEMWALLDSIPSWVKGLEVEAAMAILFGVETASKAWNHYSKLYPKGTPDRDLSIVCKVLTDYMFTCSSQALAASLPSAYVYQYNHLDSFGPILFPAFGLGQCSHRACHMAEIPFVYGNKGPKDLNVSFTSAEQAISSRLMGSFTGFAKTGDAGWTTFNASSRGGLLINQTAVEAPLGIAGATCADIWDKTGYLH